mmetsp:Transcript_15334/g.27299  ORF Transcript_15334/g.27299 Transcript_15334/m.27299 type:complete len:331 (+) Transcript_15334:615-1607(+)
MTCLRFSIITFAMVLLVRMTMVVMVLVMVIMRVIMRVMMRVMLMMMMLMNMVVVRARRRMGMGSRQRRIDIAILSIISRIYPTLLRFFLYIILQQSQPMSASLPLHIHPNASFIFSAICLSLFLAMTTSRNGTTMIRRESGDTFMMTAIATCLLLLRNNNNSNALSITVFRFINNPGNNIYAIRIVITIQVTSINISILTIIANKILLKFFKLWFLNCLQSTTQPFPQSTFPPRHSFFLLQSPLLISLRPLLPLSPPPPLSPCFLPLSTFSFSNPSPFRLRHRFRLLRNPSLSHFLLHLGFRRRHGRRHDRCGGRFSLGLFQRHFCGDIV